MARRKTITALKRVRMSRYLTQTELARKLGVQPNQVCYLERHGIRRICTALRYAAVLKCNPAELMDFEPPRACAQADNKKKEESR